MPPDLSFQQRVEDGKSHHGYANPEDRPSDPERDGSADNWRRRRRKRRTEPVDPSCPPSSESSDPSHHYRSQGRSYWRARVSAFVFRYHHFKSTPNWLAAAVPPCEGRGSVWADNS